ncbi:quinone oxidoreductase family protein [Streptomyces syringium]|uniref:quinone oxidoreductase family protein n=1 Tax=Streptomyces syringium TaxID=76729 RepID=UPI003D94BF34
MVEKPGGPEVLQSVRIPEPKPRADHELVTLIAAGVSRTDVLMRENQYFGLLEFPYIPGRELIGFDTQGRRVAGFTSDGAYAETVSVRKGLLWEVPDDLDHDEACALTLEGQTAWHLLHTALAVRRGETIVIPNAASAVGIYAVQLAKIHGCRVIAMDASGDHEDIRLQVVRDLGADAVIDYRETEGLADRIREAAGGDASAALGLIGGDVFAATLDALSFRGRMVIDGSSSPLKGESSLGRPWWQAPSPSADSSCPPFSRTGTPRKTQCRRSSRSRESVHSKPRSSPGMHWRMRVPPTGPWLRAPLGRSSSIPVTSGTEIDHPNRVVTSDHPSPCP